METKSYSKEFKSRFKILVCKINTDDYDGSENFLKLNEVFDRVDFQTSNIINEYFLVLKNKYLNYEIQDNSTITIGETNNTFFRLTLTSKDKKQNIVIYVLKQFDDSSFFEKKSQKNLVQITEINDLNDDIFSINLDDDTDLELC